MNKIINFGSINIDHVYRVEHIAAPGETISSESYETFAGGKGFNQTIALAHCYGNVYHAGCIGSDGAALVDILRENGVDISRLRTDGTCTGHAIIQVDKSGQNSILLFSGANSETKSGDIPAILDGFGAGDTLLLQNETSCLREIIDAAHAKNMTIALNPSPMNSVITSLPLKKVTWLLLNEVECEQLTGISGTDYEKICGELIKLYPAAKIVLTLGSNGAIYADRETLISMPAHSVSVVDTTAAGDTFTGFFLGSIAKNLSVKEALRTATAAAAIAVSRKGASPSIPTMAEVDALLHTKTISR